MTDKASMHGSADRTPLAANRERGRRATAVDARMERHRSDTGRRPGKPRLAPSIVRDVLRTPGRPLDPATVTSMAMRSGHDFSRVRVHDDARAAASAYSINARAYTVGNHIVFGAGGNASASLPGRRLLIHELAHVAQQGDSPASLPAHLPLAAPDSRFEQEAERMADRLGSPGRAHRPPPADAGAQPGSTVEASPDPSGVALSRAPVAVHRYTLYPEREQRDGRSNGWQHPSRGPLMVADSGEMAVEHRPWRSQKAWALPSLIAESERVLTGRSSAIRVRAGSEQIRGVAPDGGSSQERVLREVEVVDPGGGPGRLTGDCGTACLETMGGHGRNEFVGVYGPDSATRRTPATPYVGGWGVGSRPTTDRLSGPIYQAIMQEEYGRTLSPDEARAAYDRLSTAEKDRIDRKYRINRYAEAEVGQGLTAGTEFNMPGFKSDAELKRNRNMLIGGLSGAGGGLVLGGLIGLAAGGPLGMLAGALIGGALGGAIGTGVGASVDTSQENTWNFHFATVIMRSGRDSVTIENVAGRTDAAWLFMMYGPPEKKQSFHDFQTRAEHGNKSTSMVVDRP